MSKKEIAEEKARKLYIEWDRHHCVDALKSTEQATLIRAIAEALHAERRAALLEAGRAVEKRQNYWADNDRITNAYYNLDLALKDIRALANAEDGG